MREVRIVDGEVVTADGYGPRTSVGALAILPHAARWDATLAARVKCSFCGDAEVQLVSGDRAYICRRCAALSLDIFAATGGTPT